ncbi:MAG: hypothetical protein O7G83_03735 [Proteobacteria bacterium]|nr:hypothetical protein [Pseudomonadota bacterium]
MVSAQYIQPREIEPREIEARSRRRRETVARCLVPVGLAFLLSSCAAPNRELEVAFLAADTNIAALDFLQDGPAANGSLAARSAPAVELTTSVNSIGELAGGKSTIYDVAAAGRSTQYRDDFENRVSFSGDAALSNGVYLKLTGETVESWNSGAEEIAGFRIGETGKWKKGTISDVRLSLGLLDDQLRLTTRQSFSRYMDFEMDREESGQALVQRIEGDVWNSGKFSVGLFGEYAFTDLDYRDAEDLLEDKKINGKKDGEFLNPGRQAFEVGGKIGLGPVKLTLTGISESAFAGKSDGLRETGYKAAVSLNVGSLRKSADGMFGDAVWSIAPSSLWMSFESRDIDRAGGGGLPDDRTSDYTIGASWNWNRASGSVSYWRSFYDNRQPGFEDSDWVGDGLDLNLGYYESLWSIYGGLSADRSNSMGDWESREGSYSGWLSFSMRPDDLPDLTASLGVDLYRGDYTAGTSNTNDWKVAAELDFSKYLLSPDENDTSLKLVFQVNQNGAYNKWGGAATTDRDTDFFIGVRYDFIPQR